MRRRRLMLTLPGVYVLQSKLVRTARVVGRRLLTTLVAAILVLGVLRAGSRYFYCESMGDVLTKPCCHEAREASADGDGEVRSEDCCKPRSVGYLPVVAIQTLPATPPTPFVAVLSRAASAPLKASIRREAFLAHFTGPPLLSASDHRARSMVFLI